MRKPMCRLPEYPKLAFTLGPQVVCLERLPQVRQQASALAGQLYKALIHVIVTQRGGHLKGALTNADMPQHIGDARPALEKSRSLRTMRTTARASAATMMVIGSGCSFSAPIVVVGMYDWSPIECAPASTSPTFARKSAVFGTRWRLFFCGSAAPS